MLIGRCKELIIRGGENIAPGEVERVLASDPRVAEVKVVGVPDPHYGEEICACVVARGDPPPPEELQTLASRTLAPFKVPKHVVYLNRLPISGSGKPNLAVLRRLALNHLGLSDS